MRQIPWAPLPFWVWAIVYGNMAMLIWTTVIWLALVLLLTILTVALEDDKRKFKNRR